LAATRNLWRGPSAVGSFYFLAATVLLGALLTGLHLRAAEPAQSPPWQVRPLHGVLGAAGVGALLLALGGPTRGVETGSSAFGWQPAVLLVAGLVAGVTIPVLARRQERPSPLALGGLAITGFVLLWAYAALKPIRDGTVLIVVAAVLPSPRSRSRRPRPAPGTSSRPSLRRRPCDYVLAGQLTDVTLSVVVPHGTAGHSFGGPRGLTQPWFSAAGRPGSHRR